MSSTRTAARSPARAWRFSGSATRWRRSRRPPSRPATASSYRSRCDQPGRSTFTPRGGWALMSMLEGKKLLITGVVNRESIAYEVARQTQEAGAEIVLTSFGRVRRMTERSASKLDGPPDVLELDVNRPDDIEAVADDLRERWGRVDGALHAIAFAPEDALGGNFLNTPPESAATAFGTSAFSYKSLGAALAPLMERGGALVGMDFDASRAWPVYDWMGVSK